MVKYACKVTSSRCLSPSFTAVHEDIPKCMPEERLLLEPVKLVFRGFESRRAPKAYRQWIGFVLRDAKSGTRKASFVCENVFIQRFVIIRQREKRPGVSFGAMQKRAQPESGYRILPTGAKSVLSAPCRKHSNFQPLLLHE